MKKFVITEEDKKNILKMYKNNLSEGDIWSQIIGGLSRFARKTITQNEDDLIKAFKTTEAALAKNIDEIVETAIKSGNMNEIQNLEAKLINAFDPSGTNQQMAIEQTKKFLNSYAKSKGNSGWKDIRSKAQPSQTGSASQSSTATSSSATRSAKEWANGKLSSRSRFSGADFTQGTNYQNQDMFNKFMAQEAEKFQKMSKLGLDINAFWSTISAKGFEKYGIKNMRDWLRKNVEGVYHADPSKGEWSIQLKSVITDA